MPGGSSDAAGDLVPGEIAALFGESVPQVIVAASADKAETVVARAKAAGVPGSHHRQDGRVEHHHRVGGQAARSHTLSVAEAEHVWATSIEERLASREPAAVA